MLFASAPGFYDLPSSATKPPTIDRPKDANDARLRLARTQPPPLSELEVAGVLHNSLSEGDYQARPHRAAIPRSSVVDPDYYLGNSLSEGFYEMPATLRAASLRPRRRQVSAPHPSARPPACLPERSLFVYVRRASAAPALSPCPCCTEWSPSPAPPP